MTKESFKVRRARKRYLPGIVKLVRQQCREGDEKSAKQLSPTVIKPSFGRSRTSTLFVAANNKDAVGYACFYPTQEIKAGRPDLMLQDLRVTKKKRGTGVGDKMVAAIAKQAKQQKANAVCWLVNKNNKRGKEFYSRQGANSHTVILCGLKGKALAKKAGQPAKR